MLDADKLWREHVKVCEQCAFGPIREDYPEPEALLEDFCDEGNVLLEASIDAYIAQNDFGCNAMACKEVGDDCPWLALVVGEV